MAPTSTVALLVMDDDEEPSLRLLRTQRATDRAVAAGGLVIGSDGRRIGGDDRSDDLARLERAHLALTRRLGLPDPALSDAAAHFAALTHAARLVPRPFRPPQDDDPLRSISCYICALNGWSCPWCRRRPPHPDDDGPAR